MKYRSEIDGLRAFAVLPVILFHAGYTWCRGGYVGVDVFFVISGYLISSIILDDHDKGRFSLLTFYERRAKRILPALVAVILACIAVGWLLLLPAQLADLGKSVMAVALFSSNMLFWGQSNYFAPTAEQNPLLHTWSLAVEEQFYLIFPLILIAVARRFKDRTPALLFGGFLLSLGLAEWASRTHPGAAFYFAPFRAWELLLGSLAAWLLRKNPSVQTWAGAGIAAGLGLLALVVAALVFGDTTRNPSVFTLLPTLGTAAIIIWATPATFTGRLLGARPLVLIGLASYSLYLWHQPAFAFARLVYSGQAPRPLVGLLLAALGPVAYLSYRFVEVPIRASRRASRQTVLRAAVAVSLALVGIGGILQLGEGFPYRLHLAADVPPPNRGDTVGCHDKFMAEQVRRGELCVIGEHRGAASIAVLGDSHTGVLSGVFDAILAAHGKSGVLVSAGWCAPLLDFWAADGAEAYCPPLTAAAFDYVAKHVEVTTVVLVGEWAAYTAGARWGALPRAFVDSTSKSDDIEQNPEVFARAFVRTVGALQAQGKRVIVLRGVPEHEFDVPNAVVRQQVFPNLVPRHETTSLAGYQARNRDVERVFQQLPNVTFVDPADVLCTRDAGCAVADEHGTPIYGDGSHLSDIGAAKLRPVLEKALFGTP